MTVASERPAPAKVTGPIAEDASPRHNDRNAHSNMCTVPDASDLQPLYLGPENLPWAKALIDGADGPIHQYGSPEWAALPDDSRAKVAACVVAAESWRSYWDPREIAIRTRLEIAGAQMYEDQEPEVWTPEVVESVHATARQPSFADLSRLRGEPEAEARANVHRRRMGLPVVQHPEIPRNRPGDHQGAGQRPALRLVVSE